MSSSPIWYVSNVPAGLTKQVLEQQLGSFVYVHRKFQMETGMCAFTTGAHYTLLNVVMARLAPGCHISAHHRSGQPHAGLDWNSRYPPSKGQPDQPQAYPSKAPGVLDLPVPKPSTKGGSKRPAPMEPGGSVVPPRPGKGWMRPPEPAHPPKAGPVAPAAAKTGLPVQPPPSKRRKTEGKAAGKIKGKKGAVPFYKRKGSLKGKGQGNIWNECNPDDLPDLPGSLVARFFLSGAQSTGEQSAGDLNAETETNVEAGNADIDTTPKAGEAAIGTETGAGNAEIETMSEAGNAEIDTTPEAGHGGIEAKPDAGDDMTKAES